MEKRLIVNAYCKNRNPLIAPNAPVVGFYNIIEIIDIKETHRVEDLKVKAYWHPNECDFENTFAFTLQLSYLFNKSSVGNKEIGCDNMLNMVIQIISICPFVAKDRDGIEYNTTKVEWEIVDYIEPQSTIQLPTQRKPKLSTINDNISEQDSFTTKDDNEDMLDEEYYENEIYQLLNDQQKLEEYLKLIELEEDGLLFDQFCQAEIVDANSEALINIQQSVDIETELAD